MDRTHTIQIELPATHQYLNVLGACVTEMLTHIDGSAEVQDAIYGVHLAVHEICANIVDHAYAADADGRIGVGLTLRHDERQLVVDVADTGRSFDPDAVPEPDLDAAQVRGYGLFLVHQLMDDVAYTKTDGGNHWRLTKTFDCVSSHKE